MITKYIGIKGKSIEFTSYIADFLSSMIDTLSSGEGEETPIEFVENEGNHNSQALLEYMDFPDTPAGHAEFEYRKSQALMVLLVIAIRHSETIGLLMHTSKDMCRIVPLYNGIWIEIYERTNVKPFTPSE